MSIKRILAVTTFLLLASAGCGKAGDDGIATASDPSGQPSVTPSEVDNALTMRRYQQCMQDHGVIIAGPTATARPPETDAQTLQTATNACRALLPGADELVNETPEELEVRRRTAQCMRAHGYPQWPDPVPGVGTIRLPKEIDVQSPEVKTTLNNCAKQAQTVQSPNAS